MQTCLLVVIFLEIVLLLFFFNLTGFRPKLVFFIESLIYAYNVLISYYIIINNELLNFAKYHDLD